MRKIYYTENPKRRRLKQEALLVLKQTRGLIDHDLLEQARQLITARMDEASLAVPARTERPSEAAYEMIDRQKNMATIMKFIEIKSANKGLMQEMQSILREVHS
ncbi:MAG: hypothetical protein NDJ24_00380 [Alphaproteobacteria bacterium]|nr:hypothetical protein [Alphaproteobacteria bacterium]